MSTKTTETASVAAVPPVGRPGVPRDARAGLTLIEILIGMTFFAVAAMSLMNAMVYSMRLDATNEETAAATQAARRAMERLRATPFDQVFVEFNADPRTIRTVRGSAPARSSP